MPSILAVVKQIFPRIFCTVFFSFLCSSGKSLDDCIKNPPKSKKESIDFVQSVLKDQTGKSQKLSFASENLNRLQCAFSKKIRSGKKMNFSLLDVYSAYYSLPIPIELIGV